MNLLFLKKAAAVISAAAVMASFAGCQSNESTVAPVSGNNSSSGSKTTKPTTKPAATTAATEEITAEIGKKAELADVEVSVNTVYKSEYYGSEAGHLTKVLFLDLTVTNNTDTEIFTNMLTSFEFTVDGDFFDSATLFAISSARKQFGDTLNLFDQGIKPGESQTGIVPAELPDNFSQITMKFLPLGGRTGGSDTSKAVVYTFTKNDLVQLDKPES